MKNEILKTFDDITTSKEFAVGNDLVFIPDFKASFNDLFKNKVYTKDEIAYCDLFDDALLRYASTWAAKEAAYKALKQLDPKPISWKKVEIIREKIAGRPQVILHQNPNKFNISLTISHDGDYVWSAVFIQINL
ncbi:MAG: 4-phosphopantetheinyl transferase [Mucilaginibacter sp.]|jgi:holo-[acyl-carrier protein] synthase|nr:4-phosphopantetheinyl transferase [Mucilaginibacter sp.]